MVSNSITIRVIGAERVGYSTRRQRVIIGGSVSDREYGYYELKISVPEDYKMLS